MFLHVVEARYVRDYTVWVRFHDGTSGEVDLADELNGPIFEPLRNVSEFKRFQIAGHTIAWGTAQTWLRNFCARTPA